MAGSDLALFLILTAVAFVLTGWLVILFYPDAHPSDSRETRLSRARKHSRHSRTRKAA
jgi:hypothetical protein